PVTDTDGAGFEVEEGQIVFFNNFEAESNSTVDLDITQPPPHRATHDRPLDPEIEESQEEEEEVQEKSERKEELIRQRMLEELLEKRAEGTSINERKRKKDSDEERDEDDKPLQPKRRMFDASVTSRTWRHHYQILISDVETSL
ncbi:unnamed protein product, partial [Cyprideis torosa]